MEIVTSAAVLVVGGALGWIAGCGIAVVLERLWP